MRTFAGNFLAALALAGLLAGCSASSVVAQLPGNIGLPADAPARPSTPYDYPAVHDMPPPRATKPLTEEEQIRLEKELTTIRNRQEDRVPSAKKATPKAKKRPATDQTGGAQAGAKTNP